MRKIILFQGQLLSQGRTFTSKKQLPIFSKAISYSSIEGLCKLSLNLNKKGFSSVLLLWENEIETLTTQDYSKLNKDNLIIKVPNIEFPRGKLLTNKYSKTKLLHYFAMNYGISYLISNDLATDEDIIIRSRTDITFDFFIKLVLLLISLCVSLRSKPCLDMPVSK